MSISYVVIRDGLFYNKILVEYELVQKALHILLKTMQPQSCDKWFTAAELRKNTAIMNSEMNLITAIGCKIGFLETKFENGKIKFKFDIRILSVSAEQFNDILKDVTLRDMPEEVIKGMGILDFHRSRRAQFKGYGNRKIDKVPDEIMTDQGLQFRLKNKKEIDKDFVSKQKVSNEVYIGTPVHTKSVLELHEAKECNPIDCRLCAAEQNKEFGL